MTGQGHARFLVVDDTEEMRDVFGRVVRRDAARQLKASSTVIYPVDVRQHSLAGRRGVSAGHHEPLLLRDVHLVRALSVDPLLPFELNQDPGDSLPAAAGREQLEPGNVLLPVLGARSPAVSRAYAAWSARIAPRRPGRCPFMGVPQALDPARTVTR